MLGDAQGGGAAGDGGDDAALAALRREQYVDGVLEAAPAGDGDVIGRGVLYWSRVSSWPSLACGPAATTR